MFLALPASPLWGSLTCSTLGRLDSSELSFLLGGLGYLSFLRAPSSGAISSLGGGCLLVVGGLVLVMRKSLRGRLHAGLLWEGGLCLAHGVPRRVCLPAGRRRLCLLLLSEWGGGPCLSRVLGGGVGEGGLGASGVHTGVVFLLVSATSHRLAPPGKGPAPPPLHPIPGAASTIPLICNDFCLFLSFSFSDPPTPAASMRRHRPYPLRFGSFPVCLLSCQ
uniref:Uncharacterized protein n=1 Tax=Molossus molossus TaxID=27622 RepID=A0A7J8I9L7_MOLMO|nr:hypothetical protein HJG59_010548 [Molossus molossus]